MSVLVIKGLLNGSVQFNNLQINITINVILLGMKSTAILQHNSANAYAKRTLNAIVVSSIAGGGIGGTAGAIEGIRLAHRISNDKTANQIALSLTIGSLCGLISAAGGAVFCDSLAATFPISLIA